MFPYLNASYIYVYLLRTAGEAGGVSVNFTTYLGVRI